MYARPSHPPRVLYGVICVQYTRSYVRSLNRPNDVIDVSYIYLDETSFVLYYYRRIPLLSWAQSMIIPILNAVEADYYPVNLGTYPSSQSKDWLLIAPYHKTEDMHVRLCFGPSGTSRCLRLVVWVLFHSK